MKNLFLIRYFFGMKICPSEFVLTKGIEINRKLNVEGLAARTPWQGKCKL